MNIISVHAGFQKSELTDFKKRNEVSQLMDDIKQIHKYIKEQLEADNPDVEMYLDVGDYELICSALEECMAAADRLKQKKKELVQSMNIINSEFGDDLTDEEKAYNYGLKKGIDILDTEISRWLM